jgi:F-type H+-transporting ATPase subunit delta
MQTTAKVRRHAKRMFHLCFIDGRLDEQRVRLVTERVLGAKHRGYIALIKEFQRLIKLDRAGHTAEILSAEILSDDVRRRVQAALEESYGAGITTSFSHDPALIGGMRIKVGSDVYDESIQNRLASLEKRISML